MFEPFSFLLRVDWVVVLWTFSLDAGLPLITLCLKELIISGLLNTFLAPVWTLTYSRSVFLILWVTTPLGSNDPLTGAT